MKDYAFVSFEKVSSRTPAPRVSIRIDEILYLDEIEQDPPACLVGTGRYTWKITGTYLENLKIMRQACIDYVREIR